MGAFESWVYDESFSAHSDLSGKQFLAVALQSGGDVDVSANTTDKTVGILQNKPGSSAISGANHAAQVRVLGISKAIVLANSVHIGVGDYLAADSGGSGKLVKTTTDKDFVVAQALAAATADSVIIPVLLRGFHASF